MRAAKKNNSKTLQLSRQISRQIIGRQFYLKQYFLFEKKQVQLRFEPRTFAVQGIIVTGLSGWESKEV